MSMNAVEAADSASANLHQQQLGDLKHIKNEHSAPGFFQIRVARGVRSNDSGKLIPQEHSWAYHLFEDNMRQMYEQSKEGYNRYEKRMEIYDEANWFLILKYWDATSENAAFAMFRFDQDEAADERMIDVLYCYELHVEKRYKGKGLGRRLMECLELLAKENRMQKVMLTVFKHNEPALGFYKKLGYEVDETSPSKWGHDVDYEILSKSV